MEFIDLVGTMTIMPLIDEQSVTPLLPCHINP